MKGEKDMCEHKRLKTRGHRVFCCQCGAELSIDFLMNQGKQPEKAPEPVEQEQDASKPAEKAENPAKGKPGRKPTGKSTAKNKAAKNAD